MFTAFLIVNIMPVFSAWNTCFLWLFLTVAEKHHWEFSKKPNIKAPLLAGWFTWTLNWLELHVFSQMRDFNICVSLSNYIQLRLWKSDNDSCKICLEHFLPMSISNISSWFRMCFSLNGLAVSVAGKEPSGKYNWSNHHVCIKAGDISPCLYGCGNCVGGPCLFWPLLDSCFVTYYILS